MIYEDYFFTIIIKLKLIMRAVIGGISMIVFFNEFFTISKHEAIQTKYRLTTIITQIQELLRSLRREIMSCPSNIFSTF